LAEKTLEEKYLAQPPKHQNLPIRRKNTELKSGTNETEPYHVIFNKTVTWTQNMHVAAWVWG